MGSGSGIGSGSGTVIGSGAGTDSGIGTGVGTGVGPFVFSLGKTIVLGFLNVGMRLSPASVNVTHMSPL